MTGPLSRKLTHITIEISASAEIRYPGDVVEFSPADNSTDPDLMGTEGFVLRVVNASHHDPPVLVAWKHNNYSVVSWKDHQSLTLKSTSGVAELECKLQDIASKNLVCLI
jgi:hypothetical protein